MFRPVKMAKVNILLLSKYVNETTKLLGEQELLQLVDAVSQSSDKLLKSVEQEKNTKNITSLLSRCERLMEGLGVEKEAQVPESRQEMSAADISTLLLKIYSRVSVEEKAIDELLKDSGLLDKERSAIAGFPLQNIRLEALRNLTHFYMITGKLSPTIIPRAANELGERAIIVQADGLEGNVLVISSNKSRWAVKDILGKFGFTEAKAPEEVEGSASEAIHECDDELDELRTKIEEHRLNMLKLSEEYGGVLLLVHAQLMEMVAVQEAQVHFGRVSQLYCISGWAPVENLSTIQDIVDKTTCGTGVLEIIDAEKDTLVRAGIENVPVKFTGGSLLRPFQMLISNFGVPQYNEVDPTLFVAITFVLLFGYMFGDIGQGAILALAGLYMKFTKRPLETMLRDAGVLLVICGLSAILFGLAYGSIFGYELEWHLWVSPLQQEDITKLLLTAIGVGIIFTSVAIIINIINHFMAKKYFEGVFDRFGLIGLLFYWFSLGTGIYVVITGHFPIWTIFLIALPLVLLFVGSPIHKLLVAHRKKHPGVPQESEGIFNMFLEACIEVMETLTGYISGTVSFVRIGAFAISHAALCLAVFSIVKMINEAHFPGGIVVSTLVIIFGNLLVICFEGMVAMIQGVRLEYYELFGKYFNGGGVVYTPFQIKKK